MVLKSPLEILFKRIIILKELFIMYNLLCFACIWKNRGFIPHLRLFF